MDIQWIFNEQSMNIHRTNNKGYEPITNYFEKYCKKHLFYIQVLKVLEGTGYNNELDTKMWKIPSE